MSVERVFVDTNVLVYAFDDSERKKQLIAERLLENEAREICVSTQVLQELYVALTKGRHPITPTEIAERAVREAAAYSVVQVDVPLVFSAIDASWKYRISFWDALIVRAAVQAGCGALLSEDLNDGQALDGIQIENPFRRT
jgi:predicted nucleic acid-binding protein